MNIHQVVQTTLRSVSGRTVRIPFLAALLAFAILCTMPGLNLGVGVAYAQNTNATIRGQVLDPSGALVTNAQVLIVNRDTGVVVFNGKSDSSGSFVAPQVIPGTYKITVTANGLRQTIMDNVIATVAQVVSVNVNMQIGQNETAITVTSSGEELSRSTSEVSTLIAPNEVQNLPIMGRSTENLLAFVPGVSHGGAANTPNTSQLSINGGRTLNTEVLLNGVSTIVASTGSPATLPSPDGVDQFRVLATTAPAEYGRTSGAVISVNTKSGTNTYHGNVYSLARNEAFDANQYFNKMTIRSDGSVTPRNRDRYFQGGGSFSGPVVIPHVYNGRNKTFFFVNYDYTIQPNTTNIKMTVPTAAQRNGDFTNALAPKDINGNDRTPQLIYQPNGASSAAFLNNIIDPSLIDPAAKKIMALLPLPNTTGSYDKINNRYTNNYIDQQNTSGHILKFVTRVDENFTDKDRVSFNVYRYTTNTPNANFWGNQLLNTTWDCTCNNAWLPSINYTRVWNPTLVMDLNLGFFRNVVLRNPPGAGMNAAQQLGIASLPLDQTPQLIISGYNNIGADTNTNQVNITNTITPFGSITKMIGAHSLKIGASLRKNQFNSFNPSASPEGSLTFDGSVTNRTNTGNPNTSLADFLLGKVKTGNYQLPMPPTGRRNYNLGIFVQDDWKLSPKITLNAGLRWEYESPMTIANNIYTRMDPTTGQMLAAGINASNSLNINTPKTDFSPRVGVAWAITPKTVIRGAFGTFFGTIFQNLGGQVAYPGYDVSVNYNSLGAGVPQPFSLSQGFPLTGVQDLSNPFAVLATASPSNPLGLTGTEFGDLSHMPVVEQWNVGFQRTLPLAITLEANYVGNRAIHLPTNETSNMVPYSAVDAVTLANTTATTQAARPFPNLGSWGTINNNGRSSYNSLQVTARRQFDKSLAFMTNYTWAKSLDDGSTIYNFSAPNGTANAQYNPLRYLDWAVSNIDAKHTLNVAMVYTSTKGPKLLRGWRVSPVIVARTGLPVNITQTGLITNVGQQRPNGDVSNLILADMQTPPGGGAALQYLIPSTDASFPLTPSGPYYATINNVRTRLIPTGLGNVPRDAIRAPGELSFDASLSKEFKIHENYGFQFRLDAFNVINHANFQAPNASLSVGTKTDPVTKAVTGWQWNSANFGRITGTYGERRLQVSARFVF